MIYRALPGVSDLEALLSQPKEGLTALKNPPADASGGVANLWLLSAFAPGFVPESALHYVPAKSRITFRQRNTALEAHTRIIPLTLPDGIDHMIAFRLDEANIFDVQNLATFDPIMQPVESPYGIFTTIDRFAQARLCLVVGAERFLALKTLNIRMIFDLRRAVLGADRAAADPTLQDAVADLLPQDDDRDAKPGFKALPRLQTVKGADTPEAEARRAALVRLVEVTMDDLHVRRRDQIGLHILAKLAPVTCRGPSPDGAARRTACGIDRRRRWFTPA